MEEQKFRQWIKSTKEFHYWGYIIDHECEEIYGRYFASPLGPMDNNRRKSEQYTGLKDRNGTEIWEGDILRNINYSDMLIVVEWRTMTDFNNWLPKEHFEVVGNIHENPELLKSD